MKYKHFVILEFWTNSKWIKEEAEWNLETVWLVWAITAPGSCCWLLDTVAGYWLNWDWPSGLSWEALWLFFPSPTIPIIFAPKLERRFLSSSSSSFLPNEQISPPTLDDFVRGAPVAGAGLQEDRGATKPINYLGGSHTQRKWVALLLLLWRMVWLQWERLIGGPLTLKA